METKIGHDKFGKRHSRNNIQNWRLGAVHISIWQIEALRKHE